MDNFQELFVSGETWTNSNHSNHSGGDIIRPENITSTDSVTPPSTPHHHQQQQSGVDAAAAAAGDERKSANSIRGASTGKP